MGPMGRFDPDTLNWFFLSYKFKLALAGGPGPQYADAVVRPTGVKLVLCRNLYGGGSYQQIGIQLDLQEK